jgi:hypothetical protein
MPPKGHVSAKVIHNEVSKHLFAVLPHVVFLLSHGKNAPFAAFKDLRINIISWQDWGHAELFWNQQFVGSPRELIQENHRNAKAAVIDDLGSCRGHGTSHKENEAGIPSVSNAAPAEAGSQK